MARHEFRADLDRGDDAEVELLGLDGEFSAPGDLSESNSHIVDLLAPDDEPDDEEIDNPVEMALLQELGIELEEVDLPASRAVGDWPLAGVELLDLDDAEFSSDDGVAA